MTKMVRIICFLSIFILTALGTAAQDNRTKQIDDLMNREHKLGVFNGNLLVVENGRTVYQSEFGYSDAGRKTKLTSAYRFNIGSIAKEFNGVAIMMLKEQGRLTLDDKLSKFLPELPAWAQTISVKNLLQYTSGLPDIHWNTIKSDADILRNFKALDKLDFEPGTKYAYNNSNVFMQRRIIEKITGLSFQKFVETKMLKPCGMTESLVDPDLKGKNTAVSFNNDLVSDPRQYSYTMSGWTSVTARDLYRWAQCLHSWRLINQSSVKEILVPFLPGRQSSLGGGEMENNVIKEHVHQGTSFDFEALMYTAPAEGLSIILLTNNKNFRVFAIQGAIKAILKGKPYKIAKKSTLLFLDQLDNRSADEIIKLYNDTKADHPDEYDFDTESDFNQIGYSLMGKKRLDDAIKIFELNVKLFPDSSNVYDSLGEAYFNKGEKAAALLNYKKSLELDPKNEGAREIIKKLEQ